MARKIAEWLLFAAAMWFIVAAVVEQVDGNPDGAIARVAFAVTLLLTGDRWVRRDRPTSGE